MCGIFYESDKVSLFSEILTPNHQFQLYKNSIPNTAVESGYFFFFYTLFMGVICFIGFGALVRRLSTPFHLLKLFSFIVFILSINLFFFLTFRCVQCSTPRLDPGFF